MSKKVIFFGNERLATGVSTTAPTLQALIATGYDVQAVIVNESHESNKKKRQLEIAEVAHIHDIPLLMPKKLRDIADDINALQADIGVLVAFGQMVPESIIELFPHGIINIHPSLLPLHRGPAPLESVILSGETETAVSIMQLVRAMDAGPVLAQQKVKLSGNETKQALADQLLHLGGTMILELLPRLFARQANPIPQDNTQATYDQLLTKNQAIIDWSEPAVHLERKVRAYALWPGAKVTLFDQQLTLHDVQPIKNTHQLAVGECFRDKNTLEIGCGDNSALTILVLQPAGKKPMLVKDFLNGLRSV